MTNKTAERERGVAAKNHHKVFAKEQPMENKTEYTPDFIQYLRASFALRPETIDTGIGRCAKRLHEALTEIERLQAESRTAHDDAMEEAARICDKTQELLGLANSMHEEYDDQIRGSAQVQIVKRTGERIRELKHKETTDA
jgi:hypothetical protein